MTGAVAKAAGESSTEYLGMSDEDFLKINSPDTSAAAATVEGNGDQQETVDPVDTSAATPVEEEGKDEADDAVVKPESEAKTGDEEDGAKDAELGTDSNAPAGTKDAADPLAKAGDPKAKPDPKAADAKVDEKVEAKDVKPVDYEAFFKQIMTPFKANGRNIELKTPEEAIRLMQMGAGYGRKIQDLQPHLKVLRMLEKNELLDEAKLSYLIDINSNNPDAIKKKIKEAGIDPLDLNIEDNVTYNPVNHAVSDKEMSFQEALQEVQAHPQGTETLRVINQSWDQESKSLLWESPALLGVIQSQRDNGIYAQIEAEIDRQKLLGQIPRSTPFLQAYKLAGDHLTATNGFKIPAGQVPQIQNQSGDTPQTQVIATRTAAPKAQVQNGDKAAAASPTKTVSTRKASSNVNPLAMADDDFLKQFNGRL